MPRKSASFEPDPGTQTLSNCWGVSVLPLGRTSDIEKELVGRASLGTRRRPHFYTRTTQCACPEALSFRVSNPLPLLQTPSPSCSPTDLVRCACRPARSPSKPRLVSFHCSSVVSLYFGWFRSTLVVSFHFSGFVSLSDTYFIPHTPVPTSRRWRSSAPPWAPTCTPSSAPTPAAGAHTRPLLSST